MSRRRPPHDQRDLFEQAVLPLFEETRADFLEEARAVAYQIALLHGEVNIDQVRAVCPPPPDVDPRVMGAVLKGGEFELVRHEKSIRRTCHNRPIGQFKIKGT